MLSDINYSFFLGSFRLNNKEKGYVYFVHRTQNVKNIFSSTLIDENEIIRTLLRMKNNEICARDFRAASRNRAKGLVNTTWPLGVCTYSTVRGKLT